MLVADLNRMNSPLAVGQLLRVSGTWLPNSTTYISPRMINGVRGAYVVSVLQYRDVHGAWQYLAVHRGWAQQNQANTPPYTLDLPLSEVVLQGDVVASLPQVFDLTTPHLTQLGLWPNYRLAQHAAIVQKPLQPYVLALATDGMDSDAKVLSRTSHARDSDLLAEKSAKNRGYMVQWWGLCGVLCVGAIVLWRRRLK